MHKNIDQSARILHCPENLGNNAKRLSDYEKKMGFNSWSISLRKEAFGFEADQTLVKSGSFILGELARWRLLWVAVFNYEVIHFNNGKTIMPHRVPFASVRKRTNLMVAILYSLYAWLLEGKDLFVLKSLGKKIYFTYQGSDARLSTHYTKLHSNAVLADLNPDYLSPISDRYKRRRIARTERYAEAIYCLNPDLLSNFSQKAKFQPYYNIDIRQITAHDILLGDTIHIVHAPSKRDIKGTKYIIEAIEKIKELDSRIKFTLVENMRNRDAQKIYDTADILIDQLIVGWYGGVAVELMARGVPVLCFLDFPSGTSDPVLHKIKSTVPIVNTSIKTLQKDLSNLLDNNEMELTNIGKRSQSFVKSTHQF